MGEEDMEMGLLYTSAKEEVVKKEWKRIYPEDEPDDSSYMDELVTALENQGYSTVRMFIDSNIRP